MFRIEKPNYTPDLHREKSVILFMRKKLNPQKEKNPKKQPVGLLKYNILHYSMDYFELSSCQ